LLPSGVDPGAMKALDVRGKYQGEVRTSVQHVLALGLPGARWELRSSHRLLLTDRWAAAGSMEPQAPHSLVIVAPRRFEPAYNATLRKALHGRGLAARPMIQWE
jgi:hypothetical protein